MSNDGNKSTKRAPFTIFSSSAEGGYLDDLHTNFTGGVTTANMHTDTYGDFRNPPMQGPFAEAMVGGEQRRHQPLNDGTQTPFDRGELFYVTPSDGNLSVVDRSRYVEELRDVDSLVTANQTLAVAVDTVNKKLYYGTGGYGNASLNRSDFDGSSEEVLISSSDISGDVGAVCVDVDNDAVFWGETGSPYRIRKCSLDGTGSSPAEILREDAIAGESGVYGMYLDIDNQRVYYSLSIGAPSSNPDRIYRMSVNGTASFSELLVDADNEAIRGVAADADAEKLYYAETTSGEIRSVNFDGSDTQVLAQAPSAYGVALDKQRGKIYYSSGAYSGYVARVSTDGTDTEMIVENSSVPKHLFVDLNGNRIYIASYGDNEIQATAMYWDIPSANFYRDEFAKRPLNIRNIKTNSPGNFSQEYEVVQIAGRTLNPRHYAEYPEQYTTDYALNCGTEGKVFNNLKSDAIPAGAVSTFSFYEEGFEDLHTGYNSAGSANVSYVGNYSASLEWYNGHTTFSGTELEPYGLLWRSGGTPSTGTGPTGAESGTRYIYAESSTTGTGGPPNPPGSPNKYFAMSASIPSSFGIVNASFWYHMYGATMGTLAVSASLDGNVWTGLPFVANGVPVSELSGQQQASSAAAWREAVVDLSSYRNENFYLKLNAKTGTSYTSDIAIDTISFATQSLPISATYNTGTLPDYTLPDNTGSLNNFIFVNKFSAPGDRYTMSRGFLNPHGEEMSVYNASPFRNLSVRKELSEDLARHTPKATDIFPTFPNLSALLLMGSGANTGYLDLGTGLNYTDDDGFSISLWFKAPSTLSTQATLIGRASAGDRQYLLGLTAAGSIEWVCGGTVITATTGDMRDDTWHNVVAEIGGNIMGLYIDGVSVASPALAAGGDTAATSTLIGFSAETAGDFPFTGEIDEVSFWSDSIGTTGATDIYNDGKPADLLEHQYAIDLVNWWRMGDENGDGGTIIVDQVGSVDGTITTAGTGIAEITALSNTEAIYVPNAAIPTKYHTTNRNTRLHKSLSGSSSDTIIDKLTYDDGYVTHAIPQSTLQYSWISASAETTRTEFPGFATGSDIQFYSNSVGFSSPMNNVYIDPTNATQSFDFTGSVYGYNSWKEIRGGELALSRYYRNHNILPVANVKDKVTQYIEPPVVAKNQPLDYVLAIDDTGKPFSIKSAYGSKMQRYSNEEINKLEGITASDKNTKYAEIKPLYLKKSPLDSNNPIKRFYSLTYGETVFPKSKNAFMAKARLRGEYTEVPGTGSHGYDRLYGTQNTMYKKALQRDPTALNSQGVVDISLAFDPMRTDGIKSFPHSASYSGNVGELNMDTDFSITSSSPTASLDFFETNYIRINGTSSDYNERLVEEMSGKTRWYENYEDYAENIRGMKDTSILPEFRVSEHMPFYTQNGGNFRQENKDFLTLLGGTNSSSAAASNNINFDVAFDDEFLSTDTMSNFKKIKEDHLGHSTTKQITIKATGVKKLLPYNGFYPDTRTVQVANLLSESLSSDIKGYLFQPNLPSTAEQHLQSKDAAGWQIATKTLTSPGILYNTIKSGLACDYPVFTTRRTFATSSSDPTGQTYVVATTSSLTSSSGSIGDQTITRVPFQSLINLDANYPKGTSIYFAGEGSNFAEDLVHLNETASCLYSKWGGTKKPNFELGMHNFLAETVKFFIRDEKLTSFSSAPESKFGDVIAGKKYQMKLSLQDNAHMNRFVNYGDIAECFPAVESPSEFLGIEYLQTTTASVPIISRILSEDQMQGQKRAAVCADGHGGAYMCYGEPSIETPKVTVTHTDEDGTSRQIDILYGNELANYAALDLFSSSFGQAIAMASSSLGVGIIVGDPTVEQNDVNKAGNTGTVHFYLMSGASESETIEPKYYTTDGSDIPLTYTTENNLGAGGNIYRGLGTDVCIAVDPNTVVGSQYEQAFVMAASDLQFENTADKHISVYPLCYYPDGWAPSEKLDERYYNLVGTAKEKAFTPYFSGSSKCALAFAHSNSAGYSEDVYFGVCTQTYNHPVETETNFATFMRLSGTVGQPENSLWWQHAPSLATGYHRQQGEYSDVDIAISSSTSIVNDDYKWVSIDAAGSREFSDVYFALGVQTANAPTTSSAPHYAGNVYIMNPWAGGSEATIIQNYQEDYHSMEENSYNGSTATQIDNVAGGFGSPVRINQIGEVGDEKYSLAIPHNRGAKPFTGPAVAPYPIDLTEDATYSLTSSWMVGRVYLHEITPTSFNPSTTATEEKTHDVMTPSSYFNGTSLFDAYGISYDDPLAGLYQQCLSPILQLFGASLDVSIDEDKNPLFTCSDNTVPSMAMTWFGGDPRTPNSRRQLLTYTAPRLNDHKQDGRVFGTACDGVNDPAYIAYTPPGFYGKTTATITYESPVDGTMTISEILTNATIDYSTDIDDSEVKSTAGVAQDITAYQSTVKMPMKSSVNFYGKQQQPQIQFSLGEDGKSSIPEKAVQGAQTDFAWTISTRFECPVIDTSSSLYSLNYTSHRTGLEDNPIFSGTAGEYTLPRSVWTSYAEQENPPGSYSFSLKDNVKDAVEDGYESLVDLCGFTAGEKSVGSVADRKDISEAIMVVPYVDRAIKNKTIQIENGKHFFKLNKRELKKQRKNLDELGVAIDDETPSTSVSEMIEAMNKYVIPPQYNFMQYSDINPFVSYFLEFEHALSRRDLIDIWQGVMPSIAMHPETDEVEITHDIDKHNFFYNIDIPADIKFMIFKVKQKAEWNYYNVTTDSTDDTRFRFNFQGDGEVEVVPDYSYNWPYDYFSLVERAKVDVNFTLKTPKKEEE